MGLRPAGRRAALTVDELLGGHPSSREIFEAVAEAVRSAGPSETRVTRSQVAFRRDRGFAFAWRPDQYLRGHHAPLVLSVALPNRDPSPRWKEVVEPAPGRFMHHLELTSPDDVDEQVRAWLREAWESA